MSTLSLVSREWSTRPDDQRYLSLEDAYEATLLRKRVAVQSLWEFNEQTKEPMFRLGYDDNEVFVRGEKGAKLLFSHYSFGQAAQRAGAPAGYLRKLAPMLAAANLTFGLNHESSAREASKLYMAPLVNRTESGFEAVRDEEGAPLGKVLAMTGPEYGRIFDADVIKAVMTMNERSGGIWKVPAASYMATDPKRATTIYASDQDCFVFLVDDGRVIDVGGRAINRFFLVFNSEVGDRTLGVMVGYYDWVCDNRTIWGARGIQQIKIRHTKGAPARFLEQVQPALAAYANSSSLRLEAQIRQAQNTPLRMKDGKIAATAKEQTEWFKEQGFSNLISQAFVRTAENEQGSCGNIFDAIQGVNAYARGIGHQNKRVDLEIQAGELMEKHASVDTPVRITVPSLPSDRENRIRRMNGLPQLTDAIVAAS